MTARPVLPIGMWTCCVSFCVEISALIATFSFSALVIVEAQIKADFPSSWVLEWQHEVNSQLFPHLMYIFACTLSRFSHVQLFAMLWTVACQAPLSMGFFWQEYWSGLPCLPPGDLSDPGIEPMSLRSPELAGGFFTTSTPGKPDIHTLC